MKEHNDKSIFLVSKPIIPPWNDGSKNLVKNLIYGLDRYSYKIITSPYSLIKKENLENIFLFSNNVDPKIYNMKLAYYLGSKKRADIYNFFFAPNPVSVFVSSIISKLKKTLTVQTICSIPGSWKNINSLIFGDKVVVLSKYTRDKLVENGVNGDKISIIPPSFTPIVENLEQRARSARQRLAANDEQIIVLYPGDLEFSGAAWVVLRTALKIARNNNLIFVFSCRPKTKGSKAIQRLLEKEAHQGGIADKCRFLGEVPDMMGLIEASDICVLPAETTYAKLDYPMVLLEAMSLGKPIIVGKNTPPGEIVESGCGYAVTPGNVDELASTILKLAENKKMRIESGFKGKEFIYKEFNLQKIGKLYESVYNELLER